MVNRVNSVHGKVFSGGQSYRCLSVLFFLDFVAATNIESEEMVDFFDFIRANLSIAYVDRAVFHARFIAYRLKTWGPYGAKIHITLNAGINMPALIGGNQPD